MNTSSASMLETDRQTDGHYHQLKVPPITGLVSKSQMTAKNRARGLMSTDNHSKLCAISRNLFF